jgi:hypothetical protein
MLMISASLLLTVLPLHVVAEGDFGHKILGTVGLDAGSQADSGVYLGDRFIYFAADTLMNRQGNPVPIQGLDMKAFANVFGVSGTLKLDAGPYLTAAFAVPVVALQLKADQPITSIERQGLGDLFIEPLMIGWRLPRLDITSSYSIYAPTGQLNRRGYAQPQWSQQVSAGSTVFFDDERNFRLSALTSYNIYERKLNIDVTRGDTVQIQGGLGGRFFKLFDVGLVGYALWQVAADTGTDLPVALSGQSERVFGLGPELGITIPRLKARLTARYEWELGAQSRLEGQVLVVSLSMLAWRPGEE